MTKAPDGLGRELEHRRTSFVSGDAEGQDPTVSSKPGLLETTEGVHKLTDVEDALLRLSALVAGVAGPHEVFEMVATEATLLTGGEGATLFRVECHQECTIVGSCANPEAVVRRTSVDFGSCGLLAEILRTGRPTRAQRSAGVPIAVRGAVWGVLTVATGDQPLSLRAESRLQHFAKLAAGAIANVHAWCELQTFAEERAALRRVHGVAGRGGTGADVLAATAVEGSAWLCGSPTVLFRRTDDGAARMVAACGWEPPPGSADQDVHDNLIDQVLREGVPARTDDFSVGPGGQLVGGRTVQAAIGVPVIIGGLPGGAFIAGSSSGDLPPDAQKRFARFTQRITPTILSAQARTQLALEQAALRRIAELVALGAGSDEVFSEVVLQASELADAAAVALARREAPDRLRILAAHGTQTFAVGTSVEAHREMMTRCLDGDGRPLTSEAAPSTPSLADRLGMPGSVVVPVELAGELWGVLGAGSAAGALPPSTEHRLHQFADLVAAALANAHSRTEIQALADEQAALRRVAELAARDAPAEQVLNAVAIGAASLAGVGFTTLLRYDPDGSTEIVALAGAPDGVVLGGRAPGDGDGAVQRVWRTGRPARIEDLSAMSGLWPQIAHRFGYTTSVAVPITIQGALWGALVAVGKREQLSVTVEDHLTSFAELTGTAFSAAQARRDLRMLAEEQAALGRVAGLVVRGAQLDEVFNAVAAEASNLFGGIPSGLWRHETDGGFLLVANANCEVTTGFRTHSYPGTPFGELIRTGAPARIESLEGTPLATRQLKIGPLATVPITVEGRLWGAMTISTWQAPLPTDVGRRLLQFADLAGAAIANAENKAKLTTSRARVVATADETRRRLQRDVHDSAQQRLVHTIITLKLAQQAIATGAPPDALLQEALTHAERANTELRDVVRGILPAALTRGGLRTGLESLLTDLVLPVDLLVTAPRCSPHTELTAYFIIAEALTNVVKHAEASRAAVTVALEGDGTLAIEVRDDGIGGADPVRGSGLLGLVDRVDAVEGSLTLISPPGGGTTLRVQLPLQAPLPSAP